MEQLDDLELAGLARAGDSLAFAELYRRYFDPVYDFALRLAVNPADAEAIARTTFSRAMASLGGFRPGASFRGWLFAIARNTALRRLEHIPRPGRAAVGSPGLATIDPERLADPARGAEAAALAPLAWEGAAALDLQQLSLLDLHLRQGLDAAEIATVLGISRANARVMLTRLEEAAEEAIRAFIRWRERGGDCTALAEVLPGPAGDTLPSAVIELIEEHVSGCAACEARTKSRPSSLAIFAALAAVPAPADAKARILDGLLREWPGASPPPGERAAPFPPARQGAPAWRGPAALVLASFGGAAALVAGALLIPASPFALIGSHGDGVPPATVPTPTPTPRPPATRPPATPPTATAASGSPTAGPSPTPTVPIAGTAVPPFPVATATRTPAATATATPSPSAAPSPAATATPSPTTSACVPRLVPNVSSLNVAPGGEQTFLVYDAALCGQLSYSAASSETWLTVEPASGAIQAGGTSITVRAVATGLSEGKHTAWVVVTGIPGGATATVAVATTLAAEPPAIAGASGNCPSGGGAWSFTAAVSDDFAVATVVLRYLTAGGQLTAAMSGPSGASSGDWSVTIAPSPGASAFTVIATDRAGQSVSAPVSGDCE